MRLEKDPQSSSWPRVFGLSGPAIFAAIVIDQVIKEVTNGRCDLAIKHCMDGKHTGASLHYIGNAWDGETNELTAGEKARVVAKAKERVGPDYDVVLEPDHLHVEFQPKTPY